MKLPVFIKIVTNVTFYIIYVLFVTLIISFALPLVFGIFIENGSKQSSLIQFIIAVAVLFISVVYRKYFYICINVDENKIEKKVESDIIERQNKDFEKLGNDWLDILIAKEK